MDFPLLQSVSWAADAKRAAVQYVGIDHCGSDVAVAEKLLNCADVMSPFQEVDGKGMAKAVGGGRLSEL